jgi:hypothetical protein
VVPPTKLAVVARPESIKKLIDGLVAAFQRHEGSSEARARIAGALGADAASIGAHLKDPERAILGRAERPIGLTKAGVNWHPDDTRLMAADVSFGRHDAPDWLVTGEFAEAHQID